MVVRFVVVVLLMMSLGSLVPVRAADPATRSTRAATQKSGASQKFPTPDELFAKMKKLKGEDEQSGPKVAYFDLSRPIVERPPDFSFFLEERALTLQSLIDRLHQAREDKEVKAVLLTLGGADFGLAQAQEIRDALMQISKSGKRTFVYADAYDTASYIAATGASDICIMEGGEMLLPGVGLEAMFARGTLDKVGIQADYIQIGVYKGADESLTRTSASPELRGELNKLADSVYAQVIDSIASRRKRNAQQVKAIIDETLLTGAKARQRGLVDHLLDMDGLRELIGRSLGAEDGEIDLVQDYGMDKSDEPDLSSPFAFFSMLMKKPQVSDKPAIGIIYADGVIVDGEGRDSLFGDGGVGSEDMRKALRKALRDENVKAVVIRIDSPGGSALASEAMWQAVRRAAKEKPVIISIGGMAASGGYYLASAGDTIFADPTAIVGSIGVVGGKFVMKDLFGKIDLNTESFTRGRNADLFSSTQPFTNAQRAMVRDWMQETYDQFVERVLSTRRGKIKDIDKVAQGRIFLAANARELGMVDEIGGIESAIEFAAKKADLKPGEYDVRGIPGPKSLADFLTGNSDARSPLPAASMQSAAEALLGALSPSARRSVAQELRMLRLLAQHPVALLCPYTLRFR